MKAIVMSGTAVKDPEIRNIEEKGLKLAKFRIANNDSEKETEEFYTVNCWGKLAELAEKYIKKGSKIVLSGSFCNESYTGDDNVKKIRFVITARSLEFMSPKEKQNA